MPDVPPGTVTFRSSLRSPATRPGDLVVLVGRAGALEALERRLEVLRQAYLGLPAYPDVRVLLDHLG